MRVCVCVCGSFMRHRGEADLSFGGSVGVTGLYKQAVSHLMGPSLFCLLETLWQQRLMKCFHKANDSTALNTASTKGPIKNTLQLKRSTCDGQEKKQMIERARTCSDPCGYNHDGPLSQNVLLHTTFVFL